MARQHPPQDDDELVLLTYAGLQEANVMRATLESAGIFALLQGEHFAAIDTRLGGLEGVQVLVRRRELTNARALIEGEGEDPTHTEEALCPVHERPATSTCSECGSHLCDQCGAGGTCEVCVAQAQTPAAKWPPPLVKVTALVILVPIAVGVVVFGAMTLACMCQW